MAAAAVPLPELREELSLHQGAPGADGSPAWILRDPVRNRFFRLDWPTFEILARWTLGDPAAIVADVERHTTLSLRPADVADVVRFLIANQLVRAAGPEDIARLARQALGEKSSWIKWLLHHYLFFRIPLVRPDRFLDSTVGLVAWLGSRGFQVATGLGLLLGLILLVRQWDQFGADLRGTLTWQGAAAYGGALVFAKIVHELAHGYTARKLGCRVPTMGIAFLVMWPVLYTDVNETWLLRRRRDRLSVASAGVAAELTLATWATLLWTFLPDGGLRQAAFVLATVTWLSSILVNLSPFMRFDGYFLLMDAVDMPNLHGRSFAMARWWLREVLFDLREPPPEAFPRRKVVALVAFAWAVWIYRLILFLGIAVLVYHFFVKLVGIALFAVEIGWFVLMPVWRELREWRTRLRELRQRRRMRISLAGAVLVVLLGLVPWQSTVTAPAVFTAATRLPIHALEPGRIERLATAEGRMVAIGEKLAVLASPELISKREELSQRISVLDKELGAVGFDPAFQRRRQSLTEELAGAVAERLAIDERISRLTVMAPAAGRLVDVPADLHSDQWISPRERLATVVVEQGALVAYVGEDDVARIWKGAPAIFYPDAAGRPSFAAKVGILERTAVRILDAPAIAADSGGTVPVRLTDRGLVPQRAVYRVRLDTATPAPRLELRGTVRISAERTSPLSGIWRSALAVLVRETGM